MVLTFGTGTAEEPLLEPLCLLAEDELNRRLENARQESHRAKERVQQAPQEDARSLAASIAGGERGSGPRRRCMSASASATPPLSLDALQRTLDAALEERLRYVERHRDTMLSDARKDVDATGARLVAMCRRCRRCARSSSTLAMS